MAIQIENYKNAKFVDENSLIDCEIEHPIHGWIPFTLNLNDTGSDINIADLYQKIITEGDVTAYTLPTPPSEEELLAEATSQARLQRKKLLETIVDPIVSNPLRWGDLPAEEQSRLVTYRQSLLDITDQSGFPYDITWPTY